MPPKWVYEYSEPFLYTEEGDYSIGYYSVDIVGNVEEAKLFEFKIQIAPPELGIMFDPEIRDTIFVPRFATESAVLTETVGENNSHIVKLSMPSGRDLELRVSYREKSKRDTVNVELLQYDDQEPVAFSRNRYYVRFIEDEKTGGFKKLVQVFEDEGEEKIRLDYNSDKNITKIIYSTGEEKVTEERAGMLILQVYTEKGTLNYSY